MDTVTLIRVITGIVIVGLVVLAFLLTMRRSRRAKKLGTELRGVDGWLALFCIGLIAGAPLFAMKGIAANLQNPLVVILELVLAGFSVYTGLAVLRIKPNALKVVKAYFLVILGLGCLEILGSLLAAHLRGPDAAVNGMVAATDGLVGVAIWWLYFRKSKRVKATFGYNLGKPRSPASSPAPERHPPETQVSPTVAAAEPQTLLEVALPTPSADNLEQKSHVHPDQHQAPRVARWKRLSLVPFSIGAGIVVAILLAAGSYAWYRNRPTPPKTWPEIDFQGAGIKASLKTEWRDGATQYQFGVGPREPSLLAAFDQIAREHTGSFSVELEDSGGFPVCRLNLTALNPVLGPDGLVYGLEGGGSEYECSRSTYLRAQAWTFSSSFPRVAASEQKPWEMDSGQSPQRAQLRVAPRQKNSHKESPSVAVESKSQVRQESRTQNTAPSSLQFPLEGEDSVTGTDLYGHLQTRDDHLFVIKEEGEQLVLFEWSPSEKIRFTCKDPSHCLIENLVRGQAVHGVMTR